MPGVLALIGVVLLVLAGLNVRASRFVPEWWGLACVALAVFWVPITQIGG